MKRFTLYAFYCPKSTYVMREKVFSEGMENVMINERFGPAEALDADCPYLFNCKVRNQFLSINFS